VHGGSDVGQSHRLLVAPAVLSSMRVGSGQSGELSTRSSVVPALTTRTCGFPSTPRCLGFRQPIASGLSLSTAKVANRVRDLIRWDGELHAQRRWQVARSAPDCFRASHVRNAEQADSRFTPIGDVDAAAFLRDGFHELRKEAASLADADSAPDHSTDCTYAHVQVKETNEGLSEVDAASREGEFSSHRDA